MELAQIASQFDIRGRLVAINPTGSGNINDTYLAVFRTTFSEERFILQRINKRVFTRPELIMQNMRVLTEHVHRRLEAEADSADRIWQLPRIIATKDGNDFLLDDQGEYWRAITLIASATAFDSAQGTEHAIECGTVLGQFHRLVSDLDPDRIHHPLPGFHVTPQYLAKYDEVLKAPAAQARLKASVEARRLAKFVEERRVFARCLQEALDRGELKLRLVHGDPKVNNVMIDDFTGKGTCIIDLDTVMPGLIHYDFGDAQRSIGNPAGEEVDSLSQVVFDLDLCEAFVRGYLAMARDFLTPADRRYLYPSIRLIAFELGLRFFEDYLNGSQYFKTRYPEQNLNRARVQFRLCESIESRDNMIERLIADVWSEVAGGGNGA